MDEKGVAHGNEPRDNRNVNGPGLPREASKPLGDFRSSVDRVTKHDNVSFQ